MSTTISAWVNADIKGSKAQIDVHAHPTLMFLERTRGTMEIDLIEDVVGIVILTYVLTNENQLAMT